MLEASLYPEVFHAFDHGFCVIEVLVDEAGRPADYRFVEVNQAFERLTGLHAPVGRTARDLVPTLEQHWVDAYGHVARTGEARRFELASPTMARSFEVHASRIGAPERRLVALLFTEVTGRRAAEAARQSALDALRASEERFRAFADTAPAMLWVTDADGACTYLSRGWYE
jgi:PAS domain-containing protein